jgi:hypothetical protein
MAQKGNPYDCTTSASAVRRSVGCDQNDSLEKSRISTHVFSEKSVQLGGLTGAALARAILAAELACKAVVIREASGAYDGGADQQSTSVGGRGSSQVTNILHTVTGTDPAYVTNVDWWAAMRINQSKYNYLGVTESRAWESLNNGLSITGRGPIKDDLSPILGEFTVSWLRNAPFNSVPIDANLLNQAPFLAFVSAAANAQNEASLSSSDTLELMTVAVGDLLSVKVKFTGATDYGFRPTEDDGLALPEGLNINQATGDLTFTPAAGDVGEYLVTLRGESACGVLGEVQARIVVA